MCYNNVCLAEMKFILAVFSILALSSLAGGAPLLLGSPPFHSLLQSLSESRLRGPADLECDACKIVVTALQQLLLTNSSEDEIVDVITKLCIALQIEDQNVCTLGVREFKDEYLTVAAEVGLSAREACGIVLGPSCGDPYDPWHQDWNISVPDNKPPVQPIPNPKPGSPVNRILHLSDLHVDLAYTPGLSNDCGEPLCCRPPNKPGNISTAAGYWGDYNCDVPLHTLINLMQHLASVKDQFDWVYLTGDLPAHNVWNQSRNDQIFIMKTIVDLLRQYLPNKQVLPTLGNHEGVPVDSFPPPFITGEKSEQWLLQSVSELWAPWLDKQAQETLLKGGFYSIKVRTGLRVISLQTNFANDRNYWLLINDTDPAGQLEWLVQQLLDAEKTGDKVHIIGHIPPSGYTKAFGWNYHRIVNRFESTIAGQFFGHTHKDSFRIFFDEQNITRATSIAYVGPSITPLSELNMGYKIYSVDGNYSASSNAVLDYQVYFLNVTDANLHNSTNWQFEYSAKDAYGLSTLHPSDWAELVERFKKDDTLFQKFYKYMWKSHPPRTCDPSCKASTICDLLTSRTGDKSACQSVEMPPGMSTRELQIRRYKDNVC